MADTYDICYQDEIVGTVRMEQKGLYLCFSCRCRLPDDGMYRIHACHGSGWEDMGICVPMDGGFGMDKRIPAKRLGEGELTFQLVPKDWKPEAPAPEPELPVQEEETIEPEPPVPEEKMIEVEPAEETFIPVSEEEPFGYLDQLENAVLSEQNDQPGILLHEPTEE